VGYTFSIAIRGTDEQLFKPLAFQVSGQFDLPDVLVVTYFEAILRRFPRCSSINGISNRNAKSGLARVPERKGESKQAVCLGVERTTP